MEKRNIDLFHKLNTKFQSKKKKTEKLQEPAMSKQLKKVNICTLQPTIHFLPFSVKKTNHSF